MLTQHRPSLRMGASGHQAPNFPKPPGLWPELPHLMLDDGPGWVRGRSDPVGRPTQPQQTCGPVSKQSSLESQLALGGPESAHHREGMRGIGCSPPPHPPHPQGLRCMALNRGLGPHLLLRRVWRQSRSRGSGLLEASVQQLSPAQGIVRCAVTMSSVRPCSTPPPPTTPTMAVRRAPVALV